MTLPHPDTDSLSLPCAVITVSDTRTPDTDTSGQYIQQVLLEAGHQVVGYYIIPDESLAIRRKLAEFTEKTPTQVMIINGGTGIAPRDTTYDTLVPVLEKTLPGFGEIFRYLSYQEIGSRAIASRAVAGIYRNMLIFSLPGSTKGVQLAMTQLILPELVHLIGQISA